VLVDDAARAAFEVDGYVHIADVLDEQWCERLRRAIAHCRAHPGSFHGVLSKPEEPLVDSDLFRWFDDPDIAAAMRTSPLPALACELFGEGAAVLIEDQWFASDAGARTPSPWHQDDPYYNVDQPILTLWVALDDAPAAASLRVVPGSHHWGRTYAPVEFSSSSVTIGANEALLPVPAIDDDPTYEVRGLAVRAGGVIALDSRLLHATGTTAIEDRPFRRLSTRWARPGTRYTERGSQVATFWAELDHGLVDGDLLACDTFPLVGIPDLAITPPER
jgi:Phytanoyl-CoA dioxygenase (PhyH)